MSQPAARLPRRYDVDALRVIAFALLILYHVGMFYVADWEWHVKSGLQAQWLQEPMRFVNQWRMSLLFVISGLAVSFVWGRHGPGSLAMRRLWRLGVPLLFGMAVVVAPQAYYEALASGRIEPGFLRFWWRYLTFRDFPGEAWEGENLIVWTWNHLWYLPYVLLYTLAAIPLITWLEGPGRPLRRAFQALRGPWLVLLPLAPLMLYANVIYPRFPYIDHGLIGDFYAHALYGTLFFYGYLMGRDGAFWAALTRMRVPLLVLGIAAYASVRSQPWWAGAEPGPWAEQAVFASIYLNRWTWILVMLAWGHALLDRPSRWVTWGTAAVFPCYVLHQTITVVAGYELSRHSLGPVLEPLLVLTATIGGCVLLYELLIRRIALLRPLFGLPIRTAPRAPGAAGAAAPGTRLPDAVRAKQP